MREMVFGFIRILFKILTAHHIVYLFSGEPIYLSCIQASANQYQRAQSSNLHFETKQLKTQKM